MMAVKTEAGPMVVALGEAQAFVRVETGEEEALLAGLVRTATSICEQFLGTWLMRRSFETILSAGTGWQTLPMRPVASIDDVAALRSDGSSMPLAAGEYEVDLDVAGRGLIRCLAVASQRVVVSGTAGAAMSPNEVPEPVRQGVLRLVAHLFAHRDGDARPPAAVTALWRPYREVRL
ncbi:head-tail connector protein [Sphingomicrobium aestuariivivum]|uniref:head-tail connector protein n=1 Tax=Sphingomicrobium aestuariivivum TaxID=1582356 RepID=UPI001FD686C2|nr:hypothetical protein [Sphingomicrobium aestuariivivum]MCJ8191773.1 hypothetical protein [Sphingomicrobium aestuariivivum]